MRLTYTNEKGQSITFSYNPPFILSAFEGLGGADATIQRQKTPQQDGSTFIHSYLEDRAIPISFSILTDNHDRLMKYRRKLSQVCNPKLRGQLRYEDEELVRVIDVECETSPYFPSGDARGRVHQQGTIDFVALNPYWKTELIEEPPTFEPLFQFPFSGSFEMGVQRDVRIINNDSDAEIPLQMEFYGPAINPIVTNNTTGEFIKVNQELKENEVMKINTTIGEKSVRFVDNVGNERNVFHWIDLESTFFRLQIGDNEIEYSADSDIQGATFDIHYQKYYVGI